MRGRKLCSKIDIKETILEPSITCYNTSVTYDKEHHKGHFGTFLPPKEEVVWYIPVTGFILEIQSKCSWNDGSPNLEKKGPKKGLKKFEGRHQNLHSVFLHFALKIILSKFDNTKNF